MKRDSWLWALLLGLLVLGMILTLLFGKGRSRHGYGTLSVAAELRQVG